MIINYQVPIAISLFAGISTGIGALPIYLTRAFSKEFLNTGMGFSAGIMLVASFVSLILPGIHTPSTLYDKSFAIIPVIFGLLLGYLCIVFLHKKLPQYHLIKNAMSQNKEAMTRSSLIVLAICLHNIPEGLSVGVGFGAGDLANAISLGIGIAIQNMPEGLVVALCLISIGVRKNKAFLIALLTGLVEPLIAIFGFITTVFSKHILPISMGFAGGAMLFVVCQEMFPDLFRKGYTANSTRGLLIGMTLMLLIDFYIK